MMTVGDVERRRLAGRQADLADAAVLLIADDQATAVDGTTSAFFGREPGRTWAKTGFVRILVIGGSKRDSRAPDVPTIWGMM